MMRDEIREMATTAEEFRRVLKLAFPSGLSEQEGRLIVSIAGAALEITLTELAPRKLALLTLPRLEVRIRFTAGTDDQQLALRTHLERAMQRGGG